MSSSISSNDFANKAAKLWRGTAESVKSAGDSANRVYEFTESGKTRFLRLISSRDRTKAQIEAELDFIFYLRRGGVGVAPTILSVNERFVEELTAADDLFFACVFERAEGERFNYGDFNESARREHFRLRGRTLGQIHALSKSYVPSGNFRRFAWNEDRLLRETEKFLPASEKIVWREYRRLSEILSALPRAAENYGLIHGDFGETNYRYQAARLNIFDFDDCCYHWFAFDLAVSIYPHGGRPEGLRLLEWLVEGYSENAPVNFTLEDITLFCQWRLIYMFLVYARKWGFHNLSPAQDAWFANKRDNIARGYKWAL
jgi:amicoumacin kinase